METNEPNPTLSGARATAPRSTARILSKAVLAWLSFALLACQSASPSGAPSYVREITALNRHLEEQFRAGNLLGVADVYADDGVLLDARGERTAGREEIDAYWSAIESPVDWRLDIKKIRGSEVIAYEIGTSRLTTRREGQLHTSVNHFLVIWRREPGAEWRIELDAYWPAE